MHRIFFDGNRGSDEWGYPLDLPQSRSELLAIGDDLHDGLHIIIYEPGEFEIEAILEEVPDLGYWKARPIAGTVKYLLGL